MENNQNDIPYYIDNPKKYVDHSDKGEVYDYYMNTQNYNNQEYMDLFVNKKVDNKTKIKREQLKQELNNKKHKYKKDTLLPLFNYDYKEGT